MNINAIIEQIRREYKYKLELHAHTSPVSSCSRYPAVDMVRKYAELGYSGLAITNHFQPNMKSRTEDDALAFFMKDFNEAYQEGQRLGLKVYLGAEFRFADLQNDYLAYGIDERDIRAAYKYLEEQPNVYYKNCKTERNIIIQAHPFRKGLIYTPDCVDGVEAYNMHANHNANIGIAVRSACRDKKMQIAGSDLHQRNREALSAILTRTLPSDTFELAAILKSGDFVMTINDDIILQPKH